MKIISYVLIFILISSILFGTISLKGCASWEESKRNRNSYKELTYHTFHYPKEAVV